MRTVTLSQAELQYAKAKAQEMCDYDAALDLGSGKCVVERTHPDISGQGLAAEIAAAKIHKVEALLVTDQPGWEVDFYSPLGATVDVKSTHLTYGKLLVPTIKDDGSPKPLTCEFYALVIAQPPNFTWVGYATRESVSKAPVESPREGHPAYTLKQKELTQGLVP
jgi:hypothetical protein